MKNTRDNAYKAFNTLPATALASSKLSGKVISAMQEVFKKGLRSQKNFLKMVGILTDYIF